jgi:hypothetical protein
MNIMTRVLLIIVCISTFHLAIFAELIIMKQTEKGFVPLDAADSTHMTTIEKILLKYQWPMSAAHALDPIDKRNKILNETDNLFEPNQPYAEEIFIEQKIKAVTGNNTYRVVFFPTTFYELIALALLPYLENEQTHPFTRAVKECCTIDLLNIINSNNTNVKKTSAIKKIYQKSNALFMGSSEGAHAFFNTSLTNWILEHYPALTQSENSLAFSAALEQAIPSLISNIIQALIKAQQKYPKEVTITNDILSSLRDTSQNNIIPDYVRLEYEARAMNKGMITRGSSSLLLFEEPSRRIMGSTIYHQNHHFEKFYKQKRLPIYSISFGNSLFAGIVADPGACVYYYLAKVPVLGEAMRFNPDTYMKAIGYTLFINKKEYIETQNARLFFIPPLCTLAALFSQEEWFHPRTKGAISHKQVGKSYLIEGLTLCDEDENEVGLTDETGIILITRDELKHAALFSQFLADNGRILQLGDESALTTEEKQFAQNVIANQKEAARYYKGIKGMKPIWETALPRTRKKIAEKKAKIQSEVQLRELANAQNPQKRIKLIEGNPQRHVRVLQPLPYDEPFEIIED